MKAELLSYFGNDNMVVDAARVLFGKEASNYTNEQNERLINRLYTYKHTAPFRHPQFQFRIKCPIYVERQLFKHQIGISVNSISGRYIDFSDTYYLIPSNGWRGQATDTKQGSTGLINEQSTADRIQQNVVNVCQMAYQELLDLGVAKEQARSILPLNLETEFIWTGSLLAFKHLCDLRLKPDAQLETRMIANTMLHLVDQIPGKPFAQCIQAFNLKVDSQYLLPDVS